MTANVLTQSINLASFAELTEITKQEMSKYATDNRHMVMIKLPDALLTQINTVFVEAGLGEALHFLAVKRKGFFSKEQTALLFDDFHASIMIPIDNYEGTEVFFYDGTYDHPENCGVTYGIPKWDDAAAVVYSEQEITSPMILSANTPHGFTSAADGTPSTLLTIRFGNNPSFEEVCAKLAKFK